MHYLSPEFALAFLVFLWIYWLSGVGRSIRVQNSLLLAASYLFYLTFSWLFALLLLIFSLAILGLARCAVTPDGGRQRWPIVLGVVLALLNLGVFKYYNFFREECLALLVPIFQNASLPALDILLPVGISFYTFQGLAYLVSVGRGERAPAGWPDGLLYLSFFPTLLAGPICRPSELLTQIESSQSREVRAPDYALLLLVFALIKKVWLAAWLAETWVNPVFANPDAYHAVELAGAVMAYAWQLYFDFSGYTDVVTALALLLGFSLPVNFRQPYLARSVSDFWQRWHITLSRWIRDHVYIPLGGSRCGWGRTQVNALLAMGLSGFWHGASLTFIVWGLWHGLGLVAQNSWKKYVGWQLAGWLAQILTFVFVCFGWLLFRAENWAAVEAFLAGLGRWQIVPTLNWPVLVLALTAFFYWAHHAEQGADWLLARLQRLPWWSKPFCLLLVFLLIMELAPPGMPGFIYFGF